MPTISEPTWPERDDKINQVVADFLAGMDTPDVFKARLFGCNLRGQDLTAVYNVAVEKQTQQYLATTHQIAPCRVLVMERGGDHHTIRFKAAHYAAQAVEMFCRQPNVLFACRVVN